MPPLDPRWVNCSHHWKSRTHSSDTAAMRRFYVCMNASELLAVFDSTKHELTDTRNREFPILVGIISVYALFILFGTFGNGMVIYTVLRNRHMQTARNLFIVNLAVSDFTLCAVTQPLNIIRLFQYYVGWPLGMALCKMANMLTGVNMFVSAFSITAVALDRFRSELASFPVEIQLKPKPLFCSNRENSTRSPDSEQVILYPTRTQISKTNLALTLLCIWGSACLVASPLAVFATNDFNKLMIPPVNLCMESPESWLVKLVYSIAAMLLQSVLPLTIVSAAYAVIYHRMQQRARQTKERRALTAATGVAAERAAAEAMRQRRATGLLVAISVTFGISWLPLSVGNVIHDWRYFRAPKQLQEWKNGPPASESSSNSNILIVASQCATLLIVLVSACLNPIFYGWFNENFQTEFQRMLCSSRLAVGRFKFQQPQTQQKEKQQQQQQQQEQQPEAIPLACLDANGDAKDSGDGDEGGKVLLTVAEVEPSLESGFV
uniref:G_PROTEIN_RECEP_F1_2 domain-containing protein n=1 Tax=Macrostomum lignano TaxID=282301 RepID=A0A1I8JJV8_9PLAT